MDIFKNAQRDIVYISTSNGVKVDASGSKTYTSPLPIFGILATETQFLNKGDEQTVKTKYSFITEYAIREEDLIWLSSVDTIRQNAAFKVVSVKSVYSPVRMQKVYKALF